MESSKYKIDDFSLVSFLGRGAFAKVFLVEEIATEQLYALKILDKKKIRSFRDKEQVMNERLVLIRTNHPFIVQMHGAFQNDRKLYLILEYCPGKLLLKFRGGELYRLLEKRKVLSEIQTLFYAAQLVLAIEHLHSLDIIFRDLKPENVLIDGQGYLKLTDFGVSKPGVKGPKDAATLCGTQMYIAPEVLMKLSYGKPADWWALGIVQN